jgi:hypothetical protein
MASEKQVVANRANAKRSTGPKTAAGKALSRGNAYKHGLTAETIVIGDEDPQAFDRIRADLWEEYNPRLGIESELVERMAVLMWRLRRIPVFEAALIEARRAEVADWNSVQELRNGPRDKCLGHALIADSRSYDTLGKLSRYEAALMNAFNRTLQQLISLKGLRVRDQSQAHVVEILSSPSNGQDAAQQHPMSPSVRRD